MLPPLVPAVGEMLMLSLPAVAAGVGASFTFTTPGEGVWEIVSICAKVNGTASLAAFNLLFEITEPQTSARHGGLQVSTGVAAFDGWVSFALDADRFVPTVDTHTAVCPLPRYVVPKSVNVRVASSSAQAVGYDTIRYALRRVA